MSKAIAPPMKLIDAAMLAYQTIQTAADNYTGPTWLLLALEDAMTMLDEAIEATRKEASDE